MDDALGPTFLVPHPELVEGWRAVRESRGSTSKSPLINASFFSRRQPLSRRSQAMASIKLRNS
jgi:hypothetical protein